MRPTDCDFISPKQKTAGYVIPQVTHFGTALNFPPQRLPSTIKRDNRHTFGLSDRFKRMFPEALKKDPGPGHYDGFNPFLTIDGETNKSHHAVTHTF